MKPAKKVLAFVSDLEKLRSLRNYLQSHSMEITGVDDLAILESLLSQENYDCLLLDYLLIEEDPKRWIGLCKKCGGKDNASKILLLLPENQKESEAFFLAQGADACISDTGEEGRIFTDVRQFIDGLKSDANKEDFFSVTDLEGIPERRKGFQELMDQVAQITSKLEESLIRETMLKKDLEAALARETKIKDELVEASKTKDRLLSFAAHDLKNPLSVILSTIELILNPGMGFAPLNENQSQLLTMIRNNTQKLIDMVHETLDFSKIQNGFVSLNLSPCNIKDIIMEKLAFYSIAAEKKGIALTQEIEDGLPILQMDPNKIGNVIDNLIGNAVKFCSAADKVMVRAKRKDGGLFVEVADTGPGLSEKDKRNVFEPFRKLSAKPTAGETSCGLGLAISKKIVEAHGGRIEVKNVNGRSGKGAIFYFELNACSG